jgi:phosphoribosylformylglycinamidine synthase
VRAGVLSSAHDIAEGGLAVALAECCLAADLGCEVALEVGTEIFGETVGAFLVSGTSSALAGLRAHLIGHVGGTGLRISDGASAIDLPLERLREAYGALSALF